MSDEKLPPALAKKYAEIDADLSLTPKDRDRLKTLEKRAYQAKMQAKKIRAKPAENRRKEQTWAQTMIGIRAMQKLEENQAEWLKFRPGMAEWFTRPADRERWERFADAVEADWTAKAEAGEKPSQ